MLKPLWAKTVTEAASLLAPPRNQRWDCNAKNCDRRRLRSRAPPFAPILNDVFRLCRHLNGKTRIFSQINYNPLPLDLSILYLKKVQNILQTDEICQFFAYFRGARPFRAPFVRIFSPRLFILCTLRAPFAPMPLFLCTVLYLYVIPYPLCILSFVIPSPLCIPPFVIPNHKGAL